jgi:hypothetical protein
VIGEIVPAILIPRFTSWVGPGTYTTAPMAVEDFAWSQVTLWVGPLLGGAASNPLGIYFEESHDAYNWSWMLGPMTATDTAATYPLVFSKRWFRVRVVLAANAEGIVAITGWMNGAFRRRVP